MAFRIQYKIPKQAQEKFHDMLYLQYIEKLSVKSLIAYLLRYIRETCLRVGWNNKLDCYVLGRIHVGKNFDTIEFNAKILLNEFPSIMIHEILHGIFPEIEDDDIIVKIERKILKSISHKDLNNILNLFLTKSKLEYHGAITRRVGTTKRERE